jgi:hypothetical protein
MTCPEAHVPRRIHLGDDHHLGRVQHGEMTGLPGTVGDLLHERAGLRDEALEGMMLMKDFKQLQRELVALVRSGTRNVAALFQTDEHTEDFINRAPEPAGNLAVS